jgi:hypothetical protein
MTLIQHVVFSEILGAPSWLDAVIVWLNLPQFAMLAAAFAATRLAGFALEPPVRSSA